MRVVCRANDEELPRRQLQRLVSSMSSRVHVRSNLHNFSKSSCTSLASCMPPNMNQCCFFVGCLVAVHFGEALACSHIPTTVRGIVRHAIVLLLFRALDCVCVRRSGGVNDDVRFARQHIYFRRVAWRRRTIFLALCSCVCLGLYISSVV